MVTDSGLLLGMVEPILRQVQMELYGLGETDFLLKDFVWHMAMDYGLGLETVTTVLGRVLMELHGPVWV
jgi:hypothetical protein